MKKSKKLISMLLCAAMLISPTVTLGETGEIVSSGGSVYTVSGENLFESPNFIDESGNRTAEQWYVGTNTGTSWDGSVPNPATGENLTSLESVVKSGESAAKGQEAFYYSSGGAEASTGNNNFLCEYITNASGCFWNGTRSLQAYVPIEGGKVYHFSYYVSSWGSTANASVRFGAINSASFCNSDGTIDWSGSGGESVGSYNGANMTQKSSWAKKEAIIFADEDADYFFFNLYWLQETNYVCINGFTLEEVETAAVTEVEECTIETRLGSEPKLPSTLGVTYETGTTGNGSVEWNTDDVNIYRDGEYTANGTLSAGGEEYSVTATVVVYSDSINSDYSVTSDITNKNGTIEGKVTIYSDNPDGNVFAVLARYASDGTLDGVDAQILAPAEEAAATLSLPAPVEDGATARLFVWKTENLVPLTAAKPRSIELEEGGQFMYLSDVTLLDGMFKTAQELDEDYLLAIEPDRLLAPCLDSAGLTPKAERYGGWEGKYYNNSGGVGISGHSLGHWMSAMSTMYLATGNAELKTRLDYAVSELARIQDETGSGYVGGIYETPFTQAFNGTVNAGGFSLNGAWVPWYSVHKIYQGLIDAYLNTDNDQALDVAVKFADWAVDGISNMTDSQMQTMLNCEHGGMNDVFAQLYEITGNEDYLAAAVRFTHNSILTPLANQSDELTGKHANTQIPKIIGAAEIYEQDDSRTDYKTASEFFWDTVVNNRSFAIGGNSVSEHFEALGAETLHKKTCETCNTYNMIKLTEHLFAWEHDSKYMDYVETALYNDILGAQDPETGNKMYFTSLLQGHFRVYGTPENSWWCCTGSGMENPGRYAKCIYYKDRSDLYVNLYIPSEVNWRETGLSLKTETDFPYSDKATLTVENGSADAAIKLRVPSWISGDMTAVVNGSEEYSASESGYLTIERTWSAGDTIEITLPMSLNVYTARDSENKVVFKYGPIVLGAPLGTEVGDVTLPEDTREKETDIPDTTVSVPSLKTESTNPDDFIETVDLSTLTFKISGEYTSNNNDITLVPFYGIHHQFHNVYWYLNSEADPNEKALNDITIDSVIPDGQQDEIGHSQSGINSHNGSFVSGITTYYWRDAYGSADAYFSYELTVDGESKNYLYVSYWGSDGGFTSSSVSYTRSFDILVDGEKIASQTLNKENSGSTYNCFYEIPEELTSGKEKVTVKFAVQSATTCAGGVLEARTTSATLD